MSKVLLLIPNSKDGRKFLRLLRKYLNRKTYQLRVRGRKPDRIEHYGKIKKKYTKRGYNDIRLKDAETFGVYVDIKEESLTQ